MKRVLTELTQECEYTAQMYALGYEKKEIASIKCRALSTINNQLQEAFRILHVRNGRELARKLYERMAGISFTMDLSPTIRAGITCCLLLVLCIDGHFEMRRLKTFRSRPKMELSYKTRTRTKGRDIPFAA